jgi:hypothetical protein
VGDGSRRDGDNEWRLGNEGSEGLGEGVGEIQNLEGGGARGGWSGSGGWNSTWAQLGEEF